MSLPSATSIADNAFYYCRLLSDISLPAVESIGTGAFKGCTGVETISFGSSFTTVPGVAASKTPFPDWTFRNSADTADISKTAANLAGKTFQGSAAKLIEVPAGETLSASLLASAKAAMPAYLERLELERLELERLDLDPIAIDPLPLVPREEEAAQTA